MKNKKWLSILGGVFFLAACVGATSHLNPQDKAVSPLRSTSSTLGVTVVDPTTFQRVYVISDVHGMYGNLIHLLAAAHIVDSNGNWAAGRSLLIITGDSIDKGPQSIEVLDLWIKLQAQARSYQGDVIHTLGNHEAEFLADPTNKKAKTLLDEMQSRGLPITDLTGVASPRGIFIHSEPVALVVGKWMFTHSGFYPQVAWTDFVTKASQVLSRGSYGDDFLIGDSSVLEMKDWEKDPTSLQQVLSRLDSLGLFGEVFGHQPTAFGIQGRSAAKAGGRLIKIDNGMAPEAGSNPGSILVFANPVEMNQATYPHLFVISPGGSAAALMPE